MNTNFLAVPRLDKLTLVSRLVTCIMTELNRISLFDMDKIYEPNPRNSMLKSSSMVGRYMSGTYISSESYQSGSSDDELNENGTTSHNLDYRSKFNTP